MAEVLRKIYTRFGDRGQTKLLSGETVEKDDLRVNTYGALDELQSHLGMARSLIQEESVRSILRAIQKDLFVAGAELASTPERISQLGNRITTKDVNKLEDWIDQMTDRFGMPDGFIITGYFPESAALHLARSVCRRIERLIVSLNRSTGTYEELIVYINRLSDLLFVLAWSTAVAVAIKKVLDELMAVSRSPAKGRH
ncbi:MAG: cob(I)yrinic acid a,c-diamide adenosyltransferase [Thermodesulfobacteriota bacterium]